jgi:riboflavin kinase/FMN adenylyltransferase
VTDVGSVVTVGTFDGVHRGHHGVLREVARRANASGRRSVLVTFEPHPLAVVNPATAPLRLTTACERLEVVATSGVERMEVVQFDRATAALTPVEFVDQVLVGRCGMRELVIGHDHGFGRGRSGDVATLEALGAERGFPVDVIEAVTVDGGPVSSTAIRRAIAGGDLNAAARQLGRRYSLSGRVQHGERRGRTGGFPTINLDGVHVEWLAHLREIRRFDGVAALRLQLENDRLRAMATLADARVDLDAPLAAPE